MLAGNSPASIRGSPHSRVDSQRKLIYRLAEGRDYSPLPADAALTREAIAFYQVASHVFRNGLYLDEEQTPPESRLAAVLPVRRR